jgi:Secretion system C-terminal sorting domain
MKKIICLTSAFIMLFSVTRAQKFQATLKPGSTPNSVIVAIRPNGNIPGSISSMQFGLSLAKAASAVRPVQTVNSLVSGVSYGGTGIQLSEEMVAGELAYVYTISGTGDATVASTNYVSGMEYNIAEVFFNGGALGVTSIFRLVQLPNGGSTSNTNLYMALGGADAVLESAQFYGTGSTNDGQGYGGFSQVPLPGVSLPTKFISFFANKKDDNADLNWTVDNEENNAYFDVQRSLDGRLFTDVIRVNSLRNGRTSNTYTTPDLNITRLGSKVLYYRIKQVETSGEIVYSEVRQLNLTSKNFSIGLYPNPVVSATKLVVDAPESGKAFIIIRDAAGKTVQQINMEFVKGVNQKELNASMLPAGDYNVTVMGEKFNQTIKMTKAN